MTTVPSQILSQAKDACPSCEAKDIIKWGKRKGKQVYKCNPCGKYFTDNGTLPGKRIPARQVGLAMGMFFDGSSYRDIQRRFDEQFGYKPSTATLYEWVVEYSGKAKKLLDDAKAKNGDTWVADETVIKVDGGKLWLWNVIDADTRYLLATHISKTRTIKDAEALFRQAKQRAAHPPEKIITDKLAAYVDGIERVFGSRTEHVQSEGLRAKLNNNLSERMQGTIKERTKVMRGLESPNTAKKFLEGFTLHYNHMKEHDSLDKPPAKAADLPIVFDNWVEVAHLREEPTIKNVQDKLEDRRERLKERPPLRNRAMKTRGRRL